LEEVFDFFAKTEDGALVVDATQRIVFWNASARRMLGFHPDQVLGRHCYQVMAGADEKGCAVCRQDCLAILGASRGKIIATRKLSLCTKDGPKIWASVTTLVLPSRWRDLTVLAHLFRDVERHGELDEECESFLANVANIVRDPRPIDSERIDRRLTPRESEVLRLLAIGATTEAIGERLCIATTTVRTHVQRVLHKLNVHSRLEAVTRTTRDLFPTDTSSTG
jgi:PAS domain S-box-containing protein